MRRNGRGAPIPDLRALTPKRGGSTQSRHSPGRKTRPLVTKVRVRRHSLHGIIEIIGNARLRPSCGAVIRSKFAWTHRRSRSADRQGSTYRGRYVRWSGIAELRYSPSFFLRIFTLG